MLGGRLGNSSSNLDSSDGEDLPAFGFLQRKAKQSRVTSVDLTLLDSSDDDTAAAAPVAWRHRDVLRLSSDSEEADVPLAARLKLKRRPDEPKASKQQNPKSGSDVAIQPQLTFSAPPARASHEASSPPRKKAAKRSAAEIQASREEALRRREARRLEQERQKVEKKALAEAVKALRPEECVRHMVVAVDPALLQQEGGPALLAALQALGCSCAIEKQTHPASITWARRTPGGNLGAEPFVAEPHAVIHVPVEEFIAMVHSYGQEQRGVCVRDSPTLTAWVGTLLAKSAGRMPSLAVIDIEKYFRMQKSQTQKKYREAVLGKEPLNGSGKGRKKKESCEKLPEVSRVAMEEALVDLQLHTGVQVRFLSSWKDFTDHIAMSTKAVAEAPFKREREKTGFDFCLESEWAGGQRVERDGRGLLQVWKRQIQQLNRVSMDMADAILTAYPSPRLLAQAYSGCRSEREKLLLLSDVLIRRGEGITSTTRRVGPELSKRIYLLMTSSDPQQTLDSCG